jgi:hypothetical protein
MIDNMNLNNKISLFRSAMDSKPANEVPLSWFLESIRQCEFKAEIAAIRNATDPEVKAKLKKQLPAVTISGIFSQRSAANIIQHSGFICVDFDGKDNISITDWSVARNAIGSIKEVAFSALSASGNGCFAILPIAYPEQHKLQFEAMKRDFGSIGLIIDPACGDVSRLRFMSCDKDAIFNPNVIEYRRLYVPKPVKTTIKRGSKNGSEDNIYLGVRRWLDAREAFVAGNRNHYVTQLASALHRIGASESYTLAKCLEFVQEDFTDSEITKSIRTIFRNKRWAASGL